MDPTHEYEVMSVTDEHWLGLEPAQVKAPPFDFAQGRFSRKEREKWSTRRS
jgi:hypothetical protein